MPRIVVSALLILIATGGTPYANPPYENKSNNPALKAYNQGSFKTAFNLAKQSKLKRTKDAMFVMGLIYLHGEGVSKNIAFAKKYFNEAAKRGHAPSMAQLGLMVIKSNEKAGLYWLKKSANAGYLQAKGILGSMYVEGSIIDADADDGLRMLEAAADQGDHEAMRLLGNLLVRGDFIEHNIERGLPLLSGSVSMGNGVAAYELGNAYEIGLINDKKEIAEANRWYLKAAKLGNVPAMMKTAHHFSDENSEDADLKQAFKWHQRAARRGSPEAYVRVANHYFYGSGTEQDFKRGLSNVNIAIEKGVAEGHTLLGSMYFRGVGVDLDLDQARLQFWKAALMEEPKSLERIAQTYSSSKKQHDPEVYAWLLAAEKRGSEMSADSRIYYESNLSKKMQAAAESRAVFIVDQLEYAEKAPIKNPLVNDNEGRSGMADGPKISAETTIALPSGGPPGPDAAPDSRSTNNSVTEPVEGITAAPIAAP